MKLSDRERKVLAAIELQGGVPVKTLARQIGCRPHSLRYYTRRLIERGVINPKRPMSPGSSRSEENTSTASPSPSSMSIRSCASRIRSPRASAGSSSPRPIPCSSPSSTSGGALEALLHSPAFPELQALDLCGVESLESESVIAMLKRSPLTGLNTLLLSGAWIGSLPETAPDEAETAMQEWRITLKRWSRELIFTRRD